MKPPAAGSGPSLLCALAHFIRERDMPIRSRLNCCRMHCASLKTSVIQSAASWRDEIEAELQAVREMTGADQIATAKSQLKI